MQTGNCPYYYFTKALQLYFLAHNLGVVDEIVRNAALLLKDLEISHLQLGGGEAWCTSCWQRCAGDDPVLLLPHERWQVPTEVLEARAVGG